MGLTDGMLRRTHVVGILVRTRALMVERNARRGGS